MGIYRCSIDEYFRSEAKILGAKYLIGTDGCFFRTAESVAALMKAKHAIIAVPHVPGMLKVVGCWGEPSAPLEEFPDNRGIIGKAFQSWRPQLVDDVSECDGYYCYDPTVKSELAVPIVDPSRFSVNAVINVESRELGHFNHDDIELLSKLGFLMLQCREHFSECGALMERNNFLRKILDEIPDELMLIDETFRPIWANKAKRSAFKKLDAFLKLKGNQGPETIFTRERSTIPKKEDTCYCLVEKRDNRCWLCVCNRAMESGEAVNQVLYRPEKLNIIVELSAAPLFSPDGDRVGCIEVSRLVTQREKVTSLLQTLLIGLSEDQLMESALKCLHADLAYDRVRLFLVDERRIAFCGINFSGKHPKLSKKDFSKMSIPITNQLRHVSLKGDKAALVIYGEHTKSEESLAYWRITIPRDIVKSEIDIDGRLELDKVGEVACVPIISGSRRFIVFVDNKVSGKIFSYEDLQALTLFSRLASEALENIHHNERRFRLAIIGETFVGAAHEIRAIARSMQFGPELSPRLTGLIDTAQEYLQQPPLPEAAEFLSKCLKALSSQFFSISGIPAKGVSVGFTNRLKLVLDNNNIKLAATTLSDLPRLLYYIDKSPEAWIRIIRKIHKTPVLKLITKIIRLFLMLEDQQNKAVRMRVYVDAMDVAFSPTEITKVTPQYVPDIKGLLKSAVRIATKKGKDVRIVEPDYSSIELLPVNVVIGQVFLAWLVLLDNAVWAARSEGRSSLVKVEITKDDKECHVSVLNNGKKVSDKNIRYLFHEPFTTIGGTGLGLIFAHDWIVKYNRGKIRHDYDTESGMTIFTVTLPLVYPESKERTN